MLLFFPQIEEQHIYSNDDMFLPYSQIKKYIVWSTIRCHDKIHICQSINKPIEFKQIIYTSIDREIDFHRSQLVNKNYLNNLTIKNNQIQSKSIEEIEYIYLYDFHIPPIVHQIEENCFSYYPYLRSITIPTSVTFIGNNCFRSCNNLQEISLPSSLTTFHSSWFTDCINLKRIILPDSITELSIGSFSSFESLEEITIPSSITHLPDKCFANCKSLSIINGIEHIKTIGQSCFLKSGYYHKLPPFLKNQSHSKQIITKKEQQIICEWTKLSFGEILFDSFIDDWNIETSVFDSRILYKEKLLFIIESSTNEKFGCFYSTQISSIVEFDSLYQFTPKTSDQYSTDTNTFLFNL